MLVNRAYTVSQALSQGLHALRVNGIKQPSRVGDVIVHKHPVMTVYENPMNRVLFSPIRDANPFFHVMEALWMLAGRNDLPWLTRFNKRFAAYSDDGGKTQPGAYGFRWREYFGYDQLVDIINELKKNPQTRRCVLAMWDGGNEQLQTKDEVDYVVVSDLRSAIAGSADVPCNTHAYFDTIDGRLNMTVCCRSNDIIWGAYGANAVHFSFLLEYMASMTGIPMGVYRQFSNNFHLYSNIVPEHEMMPWSRDAETSDRYLMLDSRHGVVRVPVVPPLRRVALITEDAPVSFDEELAAFMEGMDTNYSHTFFSGVAVPMEQAWAAHKRREYDDALDYASHIKADDWRIAATEWLHRRKIKAEVNKAPITEMFK